jgi:UDP-N-acetylmuramyl pentapeptide phosphotransferase/UDP-N-acetylglucosamine-1-phosphate transferase
MMILVALAAAVAISGLLSWLLTHARGSWQSLDIPNERSLHTQPIPRTGGVAILIGAAAGLLILWLVRGHVVATWHLYAAVTILALLSLVDDRYSLGASLRLVVQIAVVAFLLYHYAEVTDGLLTSVALLFLVWMINLYNFMDGMDGFAAGMSVFGFGTFAILGWQAGQTEIALAYATVAAACAGFLLLNFPPARLFMGDVGSTVLGLLAGAAILQSHHDGLLPAWLGILVFSPFIVDATVTLALRIVSREPIWKAHRGHCYQRLALAGWGHRRTVLAEFLLMLACCGSALTGATLSPKGQVLIVAFWALVYTALLGWVYQFTNRRLAGS